VFGLVLTPHELHALAIQLDGQVVVHVLVGM
jgi:hypothetical protein